MIYNFKLISQIILSLAVIVGCRLLTPTSAPVVSAPPTATPVSPAVVPSPTVALPTPVPPTATLIASLPPNPAFDVADLASYRRAMRPEFAADVDAVAAAGASRYDLEVRLEWPQANSGKGPRLVGVERVRYTNSETTPLAEIYFNLYPNQPGYSGQMQVETVSVNSQAVQPELTANKAALRVPLLQPLAPGAAADLTLTYNANVPIQPDQGYHIFSASDDTIALAGFYPAIAVYDESGWNIDVPPPYGDATYLDTSLYRVKFTLPEQMVVAASGSLLEQVSNGDGTQTQTLVSGPMRDFYLVARANFIRVSEVVDSTRVNSFYPPDLESGGKLALRYAADALRVYNQRFGPYPYAEFDVVATPTTAGGVEYPGIVVVSQNLYDQPGGFFEHATVHEVAHQWWYGLVGNDQVDHPWLDESLTNYSTVFYWERVKGPAATQEMIGAFFFGPYESAKEQGQDRAVIGPVADFSIGEYGIFVYGKGPLFFNALRQEVGDETYFKIMQSYYSEYKYKVAQPTDLMAVIERISGRNVEPLVETWLQDRVVP
jgi:hypothetical protein